MAMAMMAISAVVGLVGSFAQSSALNAQAKAQEQIADFNAKQKEIEASRRQAEGVLRGQLQEKEAQTLGAKARAGFAQMGIDTTQGSPLLLEQDLAAEGQFRKNLEIASAQNDQRSLNEAAKSDRFEGQIRAMASRSQARSSLISGIGSAFSALGKINFG
jgi:hypothetical protein